MEFLQTALDIFLHLDRHLNDWAAVLGGWLYVVLFLIIFCETGLVVTPHLPGDSLLFAVGVLAAQGNSPIHLPQICLILMIAAILGDAVNYSIGLKLGPKIFSREDSIFFHKKHLLRTEAFYEKHGGKTIIWARFIPIIRTFAPFVAGVGRMNYSRFAMFNITGAVAWTLTFLLGGYYFAGLPVVKNNFHYVILAIIIISLIPPAVEVLKAFRASNHPTVSNL